MIRTVERKIQNDMWLYELPYNTLTESDCKHANKNNIVWQRNVIEDADYIMGTWHSIMSYLTNYVGVEMDANYMHPMITTINEIVED